MKIAILSLADGAGWEERWVSAFEHGSFPVEIVRRCVDVIDLLAVAASGQGRVALVAAGLRRFDADAVGRLAAAGVAVVGVLPRGDDEAAESLRQIGVAYVVPDDAEPAVIASVSAEALRVESVDALAGRTAGRAYADPTRSVPVPPGAEPVEPVEPVGRGSVIAVWGPTGAPGRSTVAMTLADEIARLGTTSLLIDADVYGGTLAVALGLLDDSPGVAAACRQAAQHRLDPAALAALCWQLSPRLRILTGVPIASRWPELRPAAIPTVLGAGRALADFTLVDCGFCLEADEELSFDTLAPRRNGATLAVLDDADVIIVVGTADPIGMHRLVRGLAELRDVGVGAPLWIVLNRLRDGAVPGDAAAEVSAALERFAGRPPAALLPSDPRSLDTALVTGRLLGESQPNSPFRRSVAELAATLTGVPAGRHRRR